jgi:Holliday junction DNA helicase RuvA
LIARIRGTIVHRTPEQVVVDVHGVGYRLLIPLSTFYRLPDDEAEVCLHATTIVREDAFLLFGFLTMTEKGLFEKLISVSKIGPRTGLNILSGLPVEELTDAIVHGDAARLSMIPGVGRKTAERLILELKDKISVDPALAASAQPTPAGRGDERVLDDVLNALVNLGYRKKEAEKVLRDVWETGERSVEGLIRKSLARLAA